MLGHRAPTGVAGGSRSYEQNGRVATKPNPELEDRFGVSGSIVGRRSAAGSSFSDYTGRLSRRDWTSSFCSLLA